MARRPVHCSSCKQTGHNRATCPTHPPAVRLPKRTGSRSERAALLADDEGISFSVACVRLGVTHQAVSMAWNRLFPGRTPPVREWREELAVCHADGMTVAQIAAHLEREPSTVYSALRSLGLQPHEPELGYPTATWDAAMAAIRNGESAAEVGARFGISVSAVTARARREGTPSVATPRGRMDGRLKRAWARVVAGERIVDAARAERCAPPALYTMRKLARSA